MLLNLIIGFCITINLCSYADQKSSYHNRTIYSPEQMLSHKEKCKMMMEHKQSMLPDPAYDMRRALASLSGEDTDYIPKASDAGEIFYNASIPYQLMHNGIKVILKSYYDSQWLTDVIQGLRGHHEPQEEKCFYEVLKYIPENATMIELGSYWAYYSLWFASEIDGATNYLIEPDPKRLDIGKKNFELNGKQGFFTRGYAGNIQDPDPDIRGAEYISIDDFLETHGITHINILHADIQGSEASMLETTIKHLNHIDYFFISTHDVQTAHIPCVEFFKRHDFIILAEHTVYESFGGDGLIVAKRKDVPGPDHIEISKYHPIE